MKFLLVHNYYQQGGGEDRSFESEVELLRSNGHDVITYTRHNDDVEDMNLLSVAMKTVWNQSTYRDVLKLIDREQPDLMHCTNTFPLISPSIYYAAKRRSVPVVQSLRNYRFLCVNASFYRQDQICERCINSSMALPGVMHGCYRGSRAGSAVVAARNFACRIMGTWKKKVDLYFAPTEFTRQKFITAGFDGDLIEVKPNFLAPDPGVGEGAGNYALFIGRLSPEKGLDTMIEAWEKVDSKLPLKIIGDGPQRELVQQAHQKGLVDWLGRLPPDQVIPLIQNATMLIMPSSWYETFGRVVMESFACGTPVVVAGHGAMYQLVTEGVDGVSFTPKNADELFQRVVNLVENPGKLQQMRVAARQTYEKRFTKDTNYNLLMNIYQRAIQLANPPRELKTTT
ncbi:MAG: glycosyltransferase [Planctomycetota bacterium]